MERGAIKTSTIYIATGEKTAVYRTLHEVPARLRRRLLDRLGSRDTFTILIADRRGAQELLRLRREQARARHKISAPRRAGALLLRYWLEIATALAGGAVVWTVLSKLAG